MKVTGYKVRRQKSTVFLYVEYTTIMDGLMFVKKLAALKLIYWFNAIPTKIPTFLGVEISKLILNLYRTIKKTNAILRRKQN